MIDYSFIIGGILSAWVFLLMLSHERQRRLDEVRAGVAPAPVPPPADELPVAGSAPLPAGRSFVPRDASAPTAAARKSAR